LESVPVKEKNSPALNWCAKIIMRPAYHSHNKKALPMEELKVKISVKVLPNDYTCDGQDISPEIDVGGVNVKIAKSLAIIPEKIPKTPVVTFPLKLVQGKNSFGKIGYNGPCPPHGQTHRYFFKVYGLDTELSLAAGATKDQLVRAMEGHVIQYGETFVTYGR
jgi:phosphatidylethanolamine-binding protein (PEBP) family uncharacterized protein